MDDDELDLMADITEFDSHLPEPTHLHELGSPDPLELLQGTEHQPSAPEEHASISDPASLEHAEHFHIPMAAGEHEDDDALDLLDGLQAELDRADNLGGLGPATGTNGNDGPLHGAGESGGD